MPSYDEAFFDDEFDEIDERRIERQPAQSHLRSTRHCKDATEGRSPAIVSPAAAVAAGGAAVVAAGSRKSAK